MKNSLVPFSRRNNGHISPWRALTEFQNEMERMMSGSFPAFREAEDLFDYTPPCDLSETDKEYSLKVDLPGIEKKDVKIEVEGSRLTVSGERREEKDEKTAKRHYQETSYGSYLRSIELPQVIDEKSVKAQFKDGVLTVTIPKNKPSNAKTVAIQ